MASRENQLFQIALIVFVMLTVVLAVTTYIYYRKAADQTARAAQAEATSNQERTTARNAVDESTTLKEFLGYTPQEPIDTIKTNKESDMRIFADTYAEDKRNYRELPTYLMAEITKLHAKMVNDEGEYSRRMAAKDQEVAQAQKSENLAKTELQKAKDDLEAMRQQFAAERTKINSDKQELANQIQGFENRNSESLAEKDKQLQELATKITNYERRIRGLLTQVEELTVDPSDTPDGMITAIGQDSKTVYLNLGRADFLNRQTTFSVFDVGVGQVSEDKVKATIVVKRILGPHYSVAQITHDSISDPVIAGDQVYSPVWRPGQRTHYALAGFMDINNDGNSDRRLVRDLIAMNGGILDAEVHLDGKVDGKISIETRYLVIGDAEKLKTPEAAAQFSKISNEALEIGVKQISLNNLLLLMGWRGGEKTVPLSNDKRANSFKPRRPPGLETAVTN